LKLLNLKNYLISNYWFLGVRVMVFIATFKNISVISWWSVLLGGGTGVPGEYRGPAFGYCGFLNK
jgi:hypothetical protein